MAAVGRRYGKRARVRNRRADLLTIVGWVSVAASIALWLADGGLAKVTSIGTALTAAGIVSGLVATDLMVPMLLLAARIPFVDRAFGTTTRSRCTASSASGRSAASSCPASS